MDITDISSFFKSYVETEEVPVVMCDLDYRIIYANRSALEEFGKYDLTVGRSLRLYMDEESLSKINVVVEWFKESTDNNRIFVGRIEEENTDLYITAVRDENNNLIGFCNKRKNRNADKCEPYDAI